MWVACGGGVDLRMCTKKNMCLLKEIALRAHNMLTILCLVVNMIGKRGGSIWPLSEHKNLHFNTKQDIHTSSKKYEANGYVDTL